MFNGREIVSVKCGAAVDRVCTINATSGLVIQGEMEVRVYILSADREQRGKSQRGECLQCSCRVFFQVRGDAVKKSGKSL